MKGKRLCIGTQILQDGDMWTNQNRYWSNPEEILCAKRNENNLGGSGSVPGPYPHANQYSTEIQCSTNHGISQREKQPDDIRQTRELKYKYGDRHF